MTENTFVKLLSVLLASAMLIGLFSFSTSAAEIPDLEVDAQSAILIEASTGQVFYEKNADQALPPASVTKIMTLLLVMEAIDSGTISLSDIVSVSDYASSMGGSQVYLKAGETMSVEDLLKSVVIASANDAAVALAEFLMGSEEAFVKRMNERAKELGMENTNFENTNGLDDTAENHLISARDIATMSRELIKHEKILEYSSTWMDSIRNGEFGLTNTNRLIRFYSGANGLKTGSTSKAKFCISASAKRDGMQLIAVIMGSPTRDIRNECAKKLLDYGFANYGCYTNPAGNAGKISVLGGKNTEIPLIYSNFSAVLPKSEAKNIRKEIILPDSVPAPINKGDKIGDMVFLSGNSEIGRVDIIAEEGCEKLSFLDILFELFRCAVSCKK